MIAYVEVTWTPTSLGGSFGRYEIQRSLNLAPWELVASVTTEAVYLYRDYEATPNVYASYRMRVVRSDGAASMWTDVDFTTAPLPASWQLTSNEAPHLNLAVEVESDVDQSHTWEFPTNEAEYRIAGRDGVVVLRGLEDPLDLFTLHIVDVASDGETRNAFDDLLALTRAVLAYVCVISPEGQRWLAACTLEQGEQTGIRQVYRSPLRVREVTTVPSVIDIAAP
jgi:hypothetical protein